MIIVELSGIIQVIVLKKNGSVNDLKSSKGWGNHSLGELGFKSNLLRSVRESGKTPIKMWGIRYTAQAVRHTTCDIAWLNMPTYSFCPNVQGINPICYQ